MKAGPSSVERRFTPPIELVDARLPGEPPQETIIGGEVTGREIEGEIYFTDREVEGW